MLESKYAELYGKNPRNHTVFLTPGRAEALGGHTDYNEGFTISANIPQNLLILGEAREDNIGLVNSLNQDNSVIPFTVDGKKLILEKSNPGDKDAWSNYIKGVVWGLLKYGIPLKGFNAVLESTIPTGAGVSSSAAIEVAAAKLAVGLSKAEITDLELVKVCREAENSYVGVPCGYLDQATITLSDGNWLFISHRADENLPFTFKNIPLDLQALGLSMVVGFDPEIKHILTEGKFKARKKACDYSILILQELLGEKVVSLRDVSPKKLQPFYNKLSGKLGERRARWIKHIVEENERVKKAANALIKGDTITMGKLMTIAGKSAIFGYELGEDTDELGFVYNLVVKEKKAWGVKGIRNMGGGFNPTTIALIETDKVERYKESVSKYYQAAFKREYRLFDFIPAPATVRLKMDSLERI